MTESYVLQFCYTNLGSLINICAAIPGVSICMSNTSWQELPGQLTLNKYVKMFISDEDIQYEEQYISFYS